MAITLPPAVKKAIHIAGIAAAFIAGVALLVHGLAVTTLPVEIMWGAIVLAASTLAVVGGATASPRGKVSPPTIGAKFERIADWAWYGIAGLVVLGLVLSFVI